MMCETIEWCRKIIPDTFWGPSRSNTVGMAARTAGMEIVLAQTVSQVRTSHSSEISTKITENKEGGGKGWVRRVLKRGKVAESWQCSIAGVWAFCALLHCPTKYIILSLSLKQSIFPIVNLSHSPPYPGCPHFLSLSSQAISYIPETTHTHFPTVFQTPETAPLVSQLFPSFLCKNMITHHAASHVWHFGKWIMAVQPDC